MEDVAAAHWLGHLTDKLQPHLQLDLSHGPALKRDQRFRHNLSVKIHNRAVPVRMAGTTELVRRRMV